MPRSMERYRALRLETARRSSGRVYWPCGVRRINATLLRAIERDYGIEEARLQWLPSMSDGSPSTPSEATLPRGHNRRRCPFLAFADARSFAIFS